MKRHLDGDSLREMYHLVLRAVERGQLERRRRSAVHPARGLEHSRSHAAGFVMEIVTGTRKAS